MIETDRKTLPAEFRLILAGSQWPLSAENLAEVRALSAAVNWERGLELIFSNRVAPLLHRALNAAGAEVPAAVAVALNTNVVRKTRLAVGQMAELARISRGLEAAGIDSFVLKGIPLSMLAFETPILREAGDIDILISPGALMEAERVLLQEGYRRISPPGALTARRLAYLIKTIKSFDYGHYGTGLAVDLHWRFFRDRFFAPVQQIVSGAGQQVLIGEQLVRTLQTDDLLIYLCLNGWTNCWAQVRGLSEVGALLQGLSSEVISALAERTAALGIGPAWQAMLIILRRFGFWSGPVASGAEDQRAVARFVRIHNLCLNDELIRRQHRARARYRLARALLLRTSWRSRLELLRVNMFDADDCELIHLPDSLIRLYFLLHPACWLVRKSGIHPLRRPAPSRPF
jgi:hypothetical protein